MSQEHGKGFIADIWPTGRCDMDCSFCYGADVPVIHPGQPLVYTPTSETILLTGSDEPRVEVDINKLKGALTMLTKAGLDRINIGGGEPLMRPETPELIKFAKETLDLTVYISTNGTFLKRRYNEIKDYIDILGLPLDGSTPEMNIEMGRREYTHKNISGMLSYFKENPPTHKVKIGTVVSKINIDDLENIGNLLFKNNKLRAPDVWRVYQFEALKDGLENRDKYEISDSQFANACELIKSRFPDVAINPRSNQDHSNAYFFVTPDLMIQTVDTSHKSFADLTTITQDELNKLINERTETSKRADQNRKWIEPIVN